MAERLPQRQGRVVGMVLAPVVVGVMRVGLQRVALRRQQHSWTTLQAPEPLSELELVVLLLVMMVRDPSSHAAVLLEPGPHQGRGRR